MESYLNKYRPVDLYELDKLYDNKNSYIYQLPREIYEEIRKYYENDKYEIKGNIIEEDLLNISKFIKTGYSYIIKSRCANIFIDGTTSCKISIDKEVALFRIRIDVIVGFTTNGGNLWDDSDELYIFNSNVIIQRVY